MKYQPYLFNYNIPAEVFAANMPDKFIQVRATYSCTLSDGIPRSVIEILDMPVHYGYMIKDWGKVENDIESIVQQHFKRLVDLDRKLEAEAVLRQMNWVEGQGNIKTA